MKYRIKKCINLKGNVHYTVQVKKRFNWIYLFTHNGDEVDSDFVPKAEKREKCLEAIDSHFSNYQYEKIKSVEIEYIVK